MKKNLLFATAVLTGVSAVCAVEPTIYENMVLTSISNNGVWAAGDIDDGSVIIVNIPEKKEYRHRSGLDAFGNYNEYHIGIGKAASNVGVVVGATSSNNAAYWENGKWTVLKTPNPEFMSNACSITPDASVICGGIGEDEFSTTAENIMLTPAVWYRQADGTYGDPVSLPHPSVDFTGRVPQYITAVAISDDGKIVAGQIRDYVGYMHEPIIYRCDDSGNWSYERLVPELINTTGKDFPEYPGEFDLQSPTPEWFMTEEELAEFTEALEEWQSGDPFPDYYDFMTQEEIQEYEEALDLYNLEYLPWAEKFDAFWTAYQDVLYHGYSFLFNNVRLSPDGKYYGATSEVMYLDDPENPLTINNPVLIDIEAGELEDLYNEEYLSMVLTSLTADYSVLAASINPFDPYMPRRAYIWPAEQKEWLPLEEFVYNHDEKVGLWMEESMIHDVYVGVDALGNLISEDIMCSGVPVATPNLSIALCNVTTDYWVDPEAGYYSYLFPTGYHTGVKGVEGELAAYAMTVEPGGMVTLKGDFNSLNVYSVAGSLVYSAQNPEGTFPTGLESGIYIFKATTAEGGEIVKKIAL